MYKMSNSNDISVIIKKYQNDSIQQLQLYVPENYTIYKLKLMLRSVFSYY